MTHQPADPPGSYNQTRQTVHGGQTNIAGDVDTGGALFSTGPITAGGDVIGRDQIIFAGGTPPGEAVNLDVALARLAELPTDRVPAVADLPHGSWMPLSSNPLFVGRQEELTALAAALKRGESAEIVPLGAERAVAATGLGGIGKTQLASSFVHRYGHYFLGGVFG